MKRILIATGVATLTLFGCSHAERNATTETTQVKKEKQVAARYNGTDAGQRLSLRALRSSQVFKVQEALRNEGAVIAIDGIAGPQTLSALARFQERHHLKADATLTTPTLSKLGLSNADFMIAE